MGLYARRLLPKLVDFTCRTKPCMRQRAKVVPSAQGCVLEVGFGSGLNLPFYDTAKVRRVWALDPSRELWAMAGERVRGAGFPVEYLEAAAEEIPLPDRSADTVLVTFTLCTLPDVSRALREMARVLKPGGELLFSEHGLAPDEDVRRWQNRLNPVWRAFAGGCNLNRPIPSLLEEGGFRLREISSMYIPGWRPASFACWGRASTM
ncbi:MAG: class I SAM-dependent methyltransferase [Deltaproteobacteria bacterium]|nr:class I SAM-dependent methyltransferase [Deltaproteobacteria bacterium]